MSTAIAIGASTLQLPIPGENYSLDLMNTNNTNIAAEVNGSIAKVKKASKVLGWGGNGTTFGTNPTAAIAAGTADIQFVPGSVAFTTDASGYAGVDFGTAFPNGYYVIGLCNGDAAASPNAVMALSTGLFTNTATKFYIRATLGNTGVGMATASLRANFMVVGW